MDGWWYEGYRKGAGWALTDKRTYTNQAHQDQLDAATIYMMLENEIIPLYFAKNSKGYSPEWIQYIKNSFAKIAPIYTTKRMLDDYIERFYNKESQRSRALKSNAFAKAKEIAAWKEKMVAAWDQIETSSEYNTDTMSFEGETGKLYEFQAGVDVKDASLNDSVAVQMVVLTTVDGEDKLNKVFDMDVVKKEGSKLTFHTSFKVQNGGLYKCAFRLIPKNADLPHKQDFCFVRWF